MEEPIYDLVSESSLSPSPTLSSSPQSNSGSGYEGSLDSSPSSDRAGRQKMYPPHSPGPGLPRGIGTESSSSGDELNISSNSTAPPMDFDDNDKDVHSLLSSEMKPLSEHMEVTHTGATQLVTNMERLSLQEVRLTFRPYFLSPWTQYSLIHTHTHAQKTVMI